jgi:hypothetical protein
MVKEYTKNMNGLNTREDLSIIPLGSYDCIIGMDWLDQHHYVLDYYNKTFTCLDDDAQPLPQQGLLSSQPMDLQTPLTWTGSLVPAGTFNNKKKTQVPFVNSTHANKH